jgi:SAM-dependent methyltransferase
MRPVKAAEQWLAAMWPVVRRRLHAPPGRIVEIGCGPLGGFVPMLRSSGYEALGVDPQAPDGDHYRRVTFEQAELVQDADAVVASTSLHHVAEPAEVLDRVATTLASGGTLIVVEWAWEDFDEATAAWCFQHLGPDAAAGWLHNRRDEWVASGLSWGAYVRAWAGEERLHTGSALLRLLDERFHRVHLARGPYFFPDLARATEESERAAIEAGQIRATRIDYVGTLRDRRRAANARARAT